MIGKTFRKIGITLFSGLRKNQNRYFSNLKVNCQKKDFKSFFEKSFNRFSDYLW